MRIHLHRYTQKQHARVRKLYQLVPKACEYTLQCKYQRSTVQYSTVLVQCHAYLLTAATPRSAPTAGMT